jgi:XRE family transcriptional regulator, regulator of sulfur utilization
VRIPAGFHDVTGPAQPTAAAFGRAVRALREENGAMSQERLAEAACISVPYLSDIERGHRNPTVAVMARIAGALGVRLSELVARAEREH